MTSTPRVAVAGHLCVDLKPTDVDLAGATPGQLLEAGPIEVTIGGAVANTGRVLASLGMPTRGFGAVGDDLLGRHLVEALGAWPGLAVDFTVAPGASSSYSLVIEPPGVDRTFWHHPGANDHFDGTAVDLAGIDLLHLGYPPLLPALQTEDGGNLTALFSRAKRDGVTTSLDLAVVDRSRPVGQLDWADLLQRWAGVTDILSPSYDDLCSALGEPSDFSEDRLASMGERLLDWGYRVVCLSAGADGFWLGAASQERLATGGRALSGLAPTWAGTRLRLPAEAITNPGTTTGAGDSATAGLLAGILLQVEPEAALRMARAVATTVISMGGIGNFDAAAARLALDRSGS